MNVGPSSLIYGEDTLRGAKAVVWRSLATPVPKHVQLVLKIHPHSPCCSAWMSQIC